MPKLLKSRPVPRRSVVRRVEGYDVVCLFALGGMAQVFLARSTSGPGRLVAIKTLRVSSIDDPESLVMFADEMRLAHLLRHPNIVELVEAGVIEGEPYLVLDYIDGPSFRELADRHEAAGSPMEQRLALSLIHQAAQGLSYAHELVDRKGRALELVHRDINPHNLMVTRTGLVKVVDFGVAKAVGQSHQTVGRGVKGKMAYAAPEYIRGDIPDQRADLFGLGVVFWELLANERLFFRKTAVGTMQAVVHDEPRPPSALRPEITETLDEVVLSLLCKDPERRVRSSSELIDELEKAALTLGGVLPVEEVAAQLARQYGAILEDRAELAPEMSDAQLRRGAVRLSVAPSASESVEIDLSELVHDEEA